MAQHDRAACHAALGLRQLAGRDRMRDEPARLEPRARLRMLLGADHVRRRSAARSPPRARRDRPRSDRSRRRRPRRSSAGLISSMVRPPSCSFRLKAVAPPLGGTKTAVTADFRCRQPVTGTGDDLEAERRDESRELPHAVVIGAPRNPDEHLPGRDQHVPAVQRARRLDERQRPVRPRARRPSRPTSGRRDAAPGRAITARSSNTTAASSTNTESGSSGASGSRSTRQPRRSSSRFVRRVLLPPPAHSQSARAARCVSSQFWMLGGTARVRARTVDDWNGNQEISEIR